MCIETRWGLLAGRGRRGACWVAGRPDVAGPLPTWVTPLLHPKHRPSRQPGERPHAGRESQTRPRPHGHRCPCVQLMIWRWAGMTGCRALAVREHPSGLQMSATPPHLSTGLGGQSPPWPHPPRLPQVRAGGRPEGQALTAVSLTLR